MVLGETSITGWQGWQHRACKMDFSPVTWDKSLPHFGPQLPSLDKERVRMQLSVDAFLLVSCDCKNLGLHSSRER